MTEEKTLKPINIFLLYGEDTFSSNQKVKFWKDSFIKKYGEDSNVEVFEGKELDITNFTTNIETLPFLCDKRLIIIKNFLSLKKREEQKKVAEALKRTPDFCIILFHETGNPYKVGTLYKTIKKIGKIEEFNTMTPLALNKWIMEKAKKENTKISLTTANYLALHVGNELWRISSELEKLQTFAQNQEITKTMIDEFVTPSLSASIFKLTDAISERRLNESLKTVEVFKVIGEDLTRVFFMIVRHFRILIQVKELSEKRLSQSEITQKLKQHPFVIQKTLSQSRNFTLKFLEEIYAKLLQIDIDFKTGVIKTYQGDDSEYKLAIEKLIIDCCNLK